MREKLSELMDGELQGAEAQALIRRLREDPEARERWRQYHLIGDMMRDTGSHTEGIAARVMQRLDREPTVFAPMRARSEEWVRRFGLQAVAGIAAMALVGWLAFAPAPPSHPPVPVAQAPKPQPTPPAEAAGVPLSAATADYLLAHQRYSPRNALQGVAPYVHTVAEEPGARRP